MVTFYTAKFHILANKNIFNISNFSGISFYKIIFTKIQKQDY